MIDNEVASDQHGEPVGTRLYLIEFTDGSSIEIPPRFLTRPDYAPPL